MKDKFVKLVEKIKLNEAEGEILVPYDLLVDKINNKPLSKNKSRFIQKTIISKGTTVTLIYAHKYSDGSIVFKIELENGGVLYSTTLAYDSMIEARKDGWDLII